MTPPRRPSAPGLSYESASPAGSHFADINISQAKNVTTLQAALTGATLSLGVISDTSGGLGNVAASAGVITVTGLDTSHAGAGGGSVDLMAAGALTVARNALLDTGTGTISLAADVNADGTGNSNSGELFLAGGATVVSENASSRAITLRGAAVHIDTGTNPGIVGSPRIDLPSTLSATLTGLNGPAALAFDGSGDLFVANFNGNTVRPDALAFDARDDLFVANGFGTTVSEFAPGKTTPTHTLTGLNGPDALAFDFRGDLFVANIGGNSVSEFAPGSTTPTATLPGLDGPQALAVDAAGDVFVANGSGTTVSEFAAGPVAGGVVIRTAQPAERISVGAASGTGLAITNPELAQIFTAASGAITFGGPSQVGTITFDDARPATISGASVVAVQSPVGSGTIVLDDASGTALAVGTGNVSLTAGDGGIVDTGHGTAAIAATGHVVLDTKGGVGSSSHPLVFDAHSSPARVIVGDSSAPATGVYLVGIGALYLGEIRTTNAPLDVTAVANLIVRGAITAGNIHLTAAALTVNAGATVATGTDEALTVSTDALTLLGYLSAGRRGILTLEPLNTSRNIDLGGTGPGSDLVVDDGALNWVIAGTLHIGDPTADTGDIDVTGTVSIHNGYNTLFLKTKTGSINTASDATIAVSALALQAGSGIGTTGDLHTAVSELAFVNRSGVIHISNTGAIDISGVDSLRFSSIPGDIYSSSVVGSVYTIAHSNVGVGGEIIYHDRSLPEGAILTLADGNRYQISYKGDGGQDVTLTRIADEGSVSNGSPTRPAGGVAFVPSQVDFETPTQDLPHGLTNKVFDLYRVNANRGPGRTLVSDALGQPVIDKKRLDFDAWHRGSWG